MTPALVGLLLLLLGAAPTPAEWRSEPVRLLAFGVLSTLTAVLTLSRRGAALPPHWRARHAATAAILLFLGWVVLSAACSPLPAQAGYEAFRHASGVLLFISVAYGISRADAVQYGRVAALGLAGAAFAGLWAYGASGGTVLSGAFGDEQLLAAALAVLLPLALAIGYRDPRAGWRAFAALTVCGGCVALLLTRNRTAWLAVALAVALQLALELWTRPESGAARRIPASALVILAGSLAIFAVSTGRMPETAARLASVGKAEPDATFRWRQEMWGTAWRMARERPLTGWGVGSFAIQQARFRPGGRTQWDVLHEGGSLSESAHNSYLRIAAELGLPGVFLYVAIPLLLAYTLVVRLRRSRPGLNASLAAASVGAVAAQAVCGYASPAWDFAQCSAFQWMVLGGAALMGRTGSRIDEARETDR
ncbi:MAG: O-antigen ligase family protein [Actinomycetota bacterium]